MAQSPPPLWTCFWQDISSLCPLFPVDFTVNLPGRNFFYFMPRFALSSATAGTCFCSQLKRVPPPSPAGQPWARQVFVPLFGRHPGTCLVEPQGSADPGWIADFNLNNFAFFCFYNTDLYIIILYICFFIVNDIFVEGMLEALFGLGHILHVHVVEGLSLGPTAGVFLIFLLLRSNQRI